jgi:hypothetical protein
VRTDQQVITWFNHFEIHAVPSFPLIACAHMNYNKVNFLACWQPLYFVWTGIFDISPPPCDLHKCCLIRFSCVRSELMRTGLITFFSCGMSTLKCLECYLITHVGPSFLTAGVIHHRGADKGIPVLFSKFTKSLALLLCNPRRFILQFAAGNLAELNELCNLGYNRW